MGLRCEIGGKLGKEQGTREEIMEKVSWYRGKEIENIPREKKTLLKKIK